MLAGNGEGIVIVGLEQQECHVSKWKIGHENAGDNGSILESLIQAIDNDPEALGENSEKAKEMFGKMIAVHKSKLVNGKPYVAPKPEPK